METSAQRCLRDYNPLGLEEYQDTVARWLGALLVLAAHLAAHPTASAAAHDARQSQLPLPPVKPTEQDLVRWAGTGTCVSSCCMLGVDRGCSWPAASGLCTRPRCCACLLRS